MLNKDYKLGSRWKVSLLLPLSLIAFLIVSCTEKDAPITEIEPAEEISAEVAESAEITESTVFMVVEEMPKFNGDAEAMEFRKYIAKNLIYPKEAAAAGVSGKIFTKFIVTKEGKVVVPDKEALAEVEGKAMDEVVVVTYRKVEQDAENPDEKYIQMLKDEAIRVITSSPDWEPGKQRGKAVNVMFTFPITFALQ